MTEKIVRGIAAGAAVALVLLYIFLPLQEFFQWENNSGRKKLELSAGEAYSWEWTPEEGEVTSAGISLTGMKKAQGLTLHLSIHDEKGNEISAARQKVSEMTENADTIRLQGPFRSGVTYTLKLEAEGEGSIKLRGLPGNQSETFEPMLIQSREKEQRNPVLLYFAAGALLAAMTPVFRSKKQTVSIKKKTPVPTALLSWLTFLMIAGLGIYITVHRPMYSILGDWRAWDEDTHWELVQQMGLMYPGALRRAANDAITWTPGYFPLTIGYNLGQIFSSDEEVLYRTAIGVSSICYAATCALAVKHAPRYKTSFLAAGTMPTILFLMTSMSYDTVVIGSILLGIALVLETLDDGNPVSPARAAAMVLLMSFGTVAKPAYSIVLLTLLMIPCRQLGGKRKAWIFRAFVILVTVWCFAAMAMPGAYEDVLGGDWRFEGASVSGQLKYIQENPLEGGLRPVRFVIEGMEPLLTWGISHWGYLGNNGRANELYLWLMLVAAPLCTMGETWTRKSELSLRRRIGFAAVALGAEIILAYGQFLASTPVGGYVQGMQPRYFIPVWIALLMALMWPHDIRRRLGKVSEWAGLAVWAACLLINVQNMTGYLASFGV